MAQLSPYLFFPGNCREAMTFYQQSLGGDLHLQTIGDSTVGEQSPVEVRQNILHSRLNKGEFVLLASDMMDAREIRRGNATVLCLNCSSEDEINTAFANLSAGGTVTSALRKEFWGGTFGTLTDKFGVDWMFSYDS
jgi:PhnB protein